MIEEINKGLYRKLYNFFPQDIYDDLVKLATSDQTPNITKHIPNRRTREGQAKYLDLPCFQNLNYNNPELDRAVEYTEMFMSTRGIERERTPTDSLGVLQGTPVGGDYGIHCDSPQKLLTLLIYIHPQQCDGTIFYDRNKENPVEDEWIPNSGYWFSGDRVHSSPPHSYKNTSDEMRWVYMWNYRGTREDFNSAP